MSQGAPETHTSAESLTTAENPLPNKSLPGGEVNLGIGTPSSHSNTPFRERKYAPNTSSPLAHSETYDSEGHIYSGEPVPAELVHHISNHKNRSHSEGAIDIQGDLVDVKKDRRKTLGISQQKETKNFIDKIDELDLSDIYGGTRYHHESPYDCALPHRNVNEQSPVLAFQHTEEKNGLSNLSQRPKSFDEDNEKTEEWKPRSSHRYTAYDNFNYMDSFLEGSTAYGVATNEVDDDDATPKRTSFLRLGGRRRNRDKDRNITSLDEEEEEDEEDNNNRGQPRLRNSKSRTSLAVFFPKKSSRDLSKKPLHPSSSQQESYLQQNEVQQENQPSQNQQEYQGYQLEEQGQLLQNAENQKSTNGITHDEFPQQQLPLNQPSQPGQPLAKNQLTNSEAKNTLPTSLQAKDRIAPLPNVSKLANRKTGARASWMQKLSNFGR